MRVPTSTTAREKRALPPARSPAHGFGAEPFQILGQPSESDVVSVASDAQTPSARPCRVATPLRGSSPIRAVPCDAILENLARVSRLSKRANATSPARTSGDAGAATPPPGLEPHPTRASVSVPGFTRAQPRSCGSELYVLLWQYHDVIGRLES
jgi:hypothetical protein